MKLGLRHCSQCQFPVAVPDLWRLASAMKSKLFICILVLAALVAGFFIGQWQTRRTIDSYMAKWMSPEVRRATADFSLAAGLIQQIYRGDTNAAREALEGELDSNIMLIGAVTEATPVAKRDKQWLSRIRWLRDHRAEHPRKTEFAAIDEEVAHVLLLVETNR
jgi:hypothetical protein